MAASFVVAVHAVAAPWTIADWSLLLLGTAALGFLSYRWLLPRLSKAMEHFTPRGRGLWLSACGGLSFLLLRALPLHAPAAPDAFPLGSDSSVWNLAFHSAHWLTLGAVLLSLGLVCSTRAPSTAASVPLRGAGFIHAIPLVVMGTVWLLALFPGMMSSDSSDQWHQALRGDQFADAHPVFHTYTIRLLQKLWASPAMVGIAQILGLAAVVAFGCATLARAGVSSVVIAVTAGLMALAPVNGAMLITLWKDIPFSLCILMMTLMLFRASANPDEPWRWPFWAGLAVLGAMTMLFRHNGVPAVLGVALALWVLRPRKYVSVMALVCATFVLAAGTRTALFRAYSATSMSSGALVLAGHLGAHVAAGTELLPEEQTILSEIHPLDDKWHYNCFSNVPTLWDGRFSYAATARHSRALPGLLARLTWRNPSATLAHVACVTSLMWKIEQGRDPLYALALWIPYDQPPKTIDPVEAEVRAEPVLPNFGARMLQWIVRSLQPDMSWLFWRPALPLYLALLACAVACVRQRNWRHGAILLPLLMHTAALVLLIPAPDMRYQYPVFLIALMLVPTWLAGTRASRPAANAGTAAAPAAPTSTPAA
ncbi:hypothetical protein JGU66_25020 [Myxococcaceae bacterium JPH2]|nr:hypothetical protein [Myxococcaceae bacterium JPH2]